MAWIPWVLRVMWLAVPFAAGPAVERATEDASSPVRWALAVLLWGAWVVGVLAVLLPRPVGLTALRVVAPASLAVALWAGSPLGAVVPAVATALALAPETGSWLVNGAAYGYERRYLLRPPGPLVLGPLVVAWALLCAGVASGPLLLAARQWVAGGAAVVVGVPVAVVLARSLHSLTSRWAVLVPAGIVLKDHLALLDPVLFRRVDVEVLQPAPADTDAVDLTSRAFGLALELSVEETNVVRVEPGRRGSPPQPGKLRRFIFTPTRPGALLDDARSRRIKVRA